VQKLKAANPDVWFPTSYQSDAILFTRTSKELDWNPKMIIAQNAGHIDPKFVEATGKDAEGYLSRSPFHPDLLDKFPVAKALNPRYKARSGKDLYDCPPAPSGHRDAADALNRARFTEARHDPRRPRQDRHQARLLCPGRASFDETGQMRGCERSLQLLVEVLDRLAVRDGGARRHHPTRGIRPEVARGQALGVRGEVRVGIDVGGTFTDLVAIDPGSGAVRSRKVLTTPEAPARGVLAGLQSLAPGAGSIAHGLRVASRKVPMSC
jgi:hypothetical protein